MTATRPSILLAVTSDMSLRLMNGFPEYLAEVGWDVHVASSPGPALQRLSIGGVVVAHSLPMQREISPMSDLRSFAAWIRLLGRVRPQLMVVGTPKAGLLGSLAGLVTRVPNRVYLLRGLRMETSRGMHRRVLLSVERLVFRAVHAVVAVSPSLRRAAVELRLGAEEKVHVIGEGSSNGVDVQLFVDAVHGARRNAANLGLVPGVPVIGYVGRWTDDKGVQQLLSAGRLLTARGVEHRVLVVGGAEGKARGSKYAPPGSEVIFTGHVSDPEAYYGLMSVLCLPTLREGFPNVVLEAAASRLATVTTDATGARDSVVHEVTGLIVEQSNVNALADALQRLIESPELAERLADAAFEHVSEHFARDRVWLRQEQWFRSFLHERAGSS